MLYLELPPIAKRLLLSANNASSESYATLDPLAPLTHSLWRFSGPSTFIFSVSPHRRTSFGACFMLCIFSVSTLELPFLFVSGNSSLHRCRNLKTYQSVICDKMTKYAIYKRISTICKNLHRCPRELKSLISSSSFVGNLRR